MSATTRSGILVEPVYDEEDVLGRGIAPPAPPGRAPFTRGISPVPYSDAPWIMGQYAGFGSARETSALFRDLLDRGATGLSVALDLPTQMGLDSDHHLAAGEVGKVGVAISCLADMERLFDGVDIGRIRQLRTTANAIGPLWIALVLGLARRRGSDPGQMRILIQNDVLKEYFARGTYIVPPSAGLHLACDAIEYAHRNLPTWTPLAMSGYHIRESGASAPQEIAFAFANGQEYLSELARRGLPAASIAPSFFAFLSCGLDVLEEVAKFRASREVWNAILESLGTPEPDRGLRIFAFTAGSSLTAQQPINNVVRVAIAATAAVLGGCQTLHTAGFDEALGVPTPEAAELALRTQQILLHESGLARTVDPLGGGYAVESLTHQLRTEIDTLLADIHGRGGALACVESGWFGAQLAEGAYLDQQAIEQGDRPIVGLTVGRTDQEQTFRPFTIDPSGEEARRIELAELRRSRDPELLRSRLGHLAEVLEQGVNCVEPMLDALEADATVGEICDVMRGVFGPYRPPAS